MAGWRAANQMEHTHNGPWLGSMIGVMLAWAYSGSCFMKNDL
jgi:hypothetical protein